MYFIDLELAIKYLLWRKQYAFLSGFMEGLFKGQSLDNEEKSLLERVFTKLCERGDWESAADIGVLLAPIYVRLAFNQAFSSGELLQAWHIANEFSLDKEQPELENCLEEEIQLLDQRIQALKQKIKSLEKKEPPEN